MVQFLRVLSFALVVLLPGVVCAASPLKVVASFSILGNIVHNVGGNKIALTTLVGPNGDTHVYEPTPANAKVVSQADLVIVNGLGFEGWMPRLVSASGYKGPIVVASRGVKSLKATGSLAEETKASGGIDPHAWQSLDNGILYTRNVATALEKADPANALTYAANAKVYEAKLKALNEKVKATLAAIPANRRVLITTHDAFAYFGRAYKVRVLAPQGMSTASEASAADVARLVRQIKADKVPAIFLENITDGRLLKQIARESGAKIGGELFTDALSGPKGAAPTYIAMFKHNLAELKAALSTS